MPQYIALFDNPPIKAISLDMGYPNYGHRGNGEWWLEVPEGKSAESAVNSMLFLGYKAAVSDGKSNMAFDNAWDAYTSRKANERKIAQQYSEEGYMVDYQVAKV